MIQSQDRAGWFGASDVCFITGRWNTKTFRRWWLAKLGLEKGHYSSTAMNAGTYFEHAILEDVYKRQHVYRENGNDLHGIFAVVRDVAELETAVPDISVRIDSIAVAENPKSGFQIWARNYFNGTHLGCSRYGVPTGKKLEEDRCMALSMLKLEKIEQRWKIIREETMFSDTMLCGFMESHLIL